MNKKNIRGVALRCAYMAAAMAAFYAAKWSCFLSITKSMFLGSAYDFWDIPRFARVICVLSILIFSSIITIVTTHDHHYKKRLMDADASGFNFRGTCAFILKGVEFRCQCGVVCALILLLPLRFLFLDLHVGFLYDVHYGGFEAFGIKLALVTAALLLIFWTNYLALNWLVGQRLRKKLRCDWKENIRSLIKQSVLTFFIYWLASAVLAIVYPILHSFFLLIKGYALFFALLAVIVIFVSLSYKHVRALIKRRGFFGQLQRLLRESDFEISEISSVYSSVFSPNDGANFVLRRGETVYSCKLVGALSYLTPLYFHDNGDLLYTKSYDIVGIDVCHVSTSQEYFFEGEGKKLIIVCPIAANLYATDGILEKKIEIEDKVMGYYIYNSSTFLGCVKHNDLP